MRDNRRRDLLHRNKLEAFRTWALANGYREYPVSPKSAWEVLRLEKIDPAGNCPHLVFYVRARGDHITTYGDGTALVQCWLALRNREAA